jgi:hypothetical protein
MTVAVATACVTWPLAQSDLHRQRREHTLQRVAGLLAENAKLVAEIRQSGGAASEGAMLSVYLDQVRKDGVPRHSATKRSIDRLVDNNTAIVALTRHYLEHHGSAAFRAAAHQYIDYAASVRDRWQSVFEIFMAGGNLPAANGERPAVFDKELQAEWPGVARPNPGLDWRVQVPVTR